MDQAREDAVQRGRWQIDPLRVDRPEVHVLDPQLGGARTRLLDHLRHDVRADELAARLDELGRDEARVAGPGGELEHAVTRLGVDRIDEPGGHRCPVDAHVREGPQPFCAASVSSPRARVRSSSARNLYLWSS